MQGKSYRPCAATRRRVSRHGQESLDRGEKRRLLRLLAVIRNRCRKPRRADFGFWILDFGLRACCQSKIPNPKSKIERPAESQTEHGNRSPFPGRVRPRSLYW